jgi:zinc protease
LVIAHGSGKNPSMKIRTPLLRFVLPVVFLVAIASAQTLPTGVERRATMAGITEYAYPNGLRVLLLPDAGSATMTVNMIYMVGSRHEGYGETGMAHLLEHMNFILTTDGRNIKQELTGRGATWNGTTSYDRTNYYETFKASEDNLKWALGLEADRMVKMRIEKPLLDTEMTVVRNEFERGENSVANVLAERVLSTAFLWHNYGKSTIGSRQDIEKVPIDRLAAFYRKYYQPDNAVLVVAGPIDPANTLATIAQSLGAIPRPTRKLDETYTVEPIQDGERYVELRRVGKGKNLMIAYHAPALAHPDDGTIEVMEAVLTGPGGSGRLYKALVESKKALSVNMSIMELHDPGLVTVSVSLNDDQSVDEAKKIVYDTIANLVKEPPTRDEVERARNSIVQRMDREFTNSQALAMSMTDMAAAGDWRLLFMNYEEIKRATAEDIVQVAKTYFKDSNRTVGVFIPEAAPDRVGVPESPSMDQLLRDYPTSINVTDGEVLDPTPASIEKRITRLKLPSGFKVVLLPKGTRGNTVTAEINIRYGNEALLTGKNAAAQMAGSLLMRGTSSMSRQQIQDAMQKINARIGISGGLSSASASIDTTAENLIPAIRLAVQILKDPAFPESDFEQIRTQQIAAIERGRTEPGTLATEAIQANLSPFPRTDIRHSRTIDEQIEDMKKVTLEDVKSFYRQFYGASTGEMVVVGKFTPDEVRKVAEETLASWKSPSPYARIASKALPVTPINRKIETPDKENAQFNAGLRIAMSDTDPDYPAMVVANYMFGGSISSRLADRIRNREGLSYSVSSSFSAPALGDAALFSASAISNPKNTPAVEASFRDELTKTLASGFTAAELADAKKSIRDQRIVSRSSDSGLQRLIMTREELDRTLAWDEKIDAAIDTLTLDQVNAAFRKRVNVAGVSIVKAGDFKKAGVLQ